MTVELEVSPELLDAIGTEQFEAYLRLFNATVVSVQPDPFWVTYTVGIPDAPPNAVRVVPLFQSHGNTVSILSIDYWDAAGHIIPPNPKRPGATP